MGKRGWLCQMGLRPGAPRKLESAPRRHRPQHTSPRPSGTACPFQVSSLPVCNTEEPSGAKGRLRIRSPSLAGAARAVGLVVPPPCPCPTSCSAPTSRPTVPLLVLLSPGGEWGFLPVKERDCALLITVTSGARRLFCTH